MTSDAIIITALADDVAALEHDLVVAREMLRASLAAQHQLWQQHCALERRYADVREELRRYVTARVASR